MVMVKLKGVAKTKAKGRTYYYAWRGGPRLEGEPGSPEFVASYNAAHASAKAPDPELFRSVVISYRKNALPALAETTRRQWAPWLDRIEAHFGKLKIAHFKNVERIALTIRGWRNRYAATPRTADYGMQVLSAVLAHAIEPMGKLAKNPCEGIKPLYKADRSETIWTDADIEKLKKEASPEIGWAVDLAAYSGLRQGDLLNLAWSHIEEDAIIIRTSKSKYKREALIPLYDELREVLARIPKRSTKVLTSSKGTPWTSGGFGSSFNKAKIAAKMHDNDGVDLNFNDLRGTAATKIYVGGIDIRVIAEILAWDEESVKKIIRRYVGRKAATMAFIEKMKKGKS